MSSMKEKHFVNVAWVIAEYLCKGAPGIREISDICGGHYVTKRARSLGYLVNDEVNKCSEPIECEEWTAKNFTKEFDTEYMSLQQHEFEGYQGAPKDDYIFTSTMLGYGRNSIVPSLGYEIGGSSRRVHDDDDEMND
ncbi:hypothetical protein Tco_1123338 [Tanacetum coccineum]|uniref:Uncharacterized protein n=1 Tax=Tanacetum coccineum TaxID=301880 RepID=A0ABQ5J339_9ASTR